MNGERTYGESRGGYRQGGNQGERADGPRRRGTPLSDLDPKLTEISRKTIGCAIEVHMELGPGYDESVYLKALMHELKAEGVSHKTGQTFPVQFDEEVVGEVTADLWVADRFIVEVMARPGEITSFERAQLRSQLRAADVELGLIINFGERRLKDGLVRVLNPDKLNAMREGEDHDDDHDDVEEESH